MIWFDDFGADLAARGWAVREAAGHPGVPGARWGGVEIVDDPERPGNKLLRLSAQTDGTPQGTQQAQACHRRRLLHGTYAARVRFSDEPAAGADGDPVVQTFYAVSPLRHDLDPDFSEVDFEYLPNGGWGSDRTRLYAISWQTVRIEPWQAWNQAHESFGSFAGWHELLIQVQPGRTRHYLDGRLLAQHGGRNVPAVPMAAQFNLWFSPAGLLPPAAGTRRWVQEVDWVLHVPDAQLAPEQVRAQVQALRAAGRDHVDQITAPVLPAACDL